MPVLTGPATRAVETVFTVLARLRAARAFHPRGALFAGRVELDGPGSPTVAVLGGGVHPALVRVSKGAGTPGRLPDLLGLAVRLTDWSPVLPLLKRDIRTRVGPDTFTYVRLPQRMFKFLERY